MRIGIDVGGTFTDVVLVDDEGKFYYTKATTTHYDLAEGVLNGLADILQMSGKSLKETDTIVHGTTIGTNAIVEGNGARASLITTKGFEDVLEIRRVARPKEAAYDFEVDNPPPLVPRYLRKGIIERTNHKGEVVIPLDETSVRQVVAFFKKEQVDAIVVSLLFSFLNPAHELRVAEICREMMPGIDVSLSHEICPEFREYERTCTTVMNGYLGPVISEYMDNLVARLTKRYGKVDLHIMQSNGGSMTVDIAKHYSANLINSGPAAGAIASAFITKLMGRDLAVGADMGGTTFDISLIDGGIPRSTTWGGVTEYPIKLPMVDMTTIGAGGGSIAWIDDMGALNAGPQSAGSQPGPSCYGTGGELPTITDANLVLHRLDPKYFLGGRQQIYPEKAYQAIKEHVADKLGMSVEEAALGIIRIANANMAKGISGSSVERGYDLRDFMLIAFGGACSLHAVEIARELHIPEVVAPPMSGLYSAVGLVVADIQHDYVRTMKARMDELTGPEIQAIFQELEEKGIQQLREEKVKEEDMVLEWSADMRYEGQSWELNISIARTDTVGPQEIAQIESIFHEEHQKAYSYSNPGEVVEFVNFRVRAKGKATKATLPSYPEDPTPPSAALKDRRVVWFDEGPLEIPVYERDLFGVGSSVDGPCIIEERVSTTLVPAGCTCRIDAFKNLVVSTGEDED
ncbi:MAG: hydantoinase/oxoprolinase family protein [Dehalococcoidia bacterium]|nr:hydantoinase/oxoprolinase family protein [Dehalococcoidia bacterium]